MIAKQDQLAPGMAQEAYPDEAQRGLYLAGHDLEGIRRRQRMMSRLRVLLGASSRGSDSQLSG